MNIKKIMTANVWMFASASVLPMVSIVRAAPDDEKPATEISAVAIGANRVATFTTSKKAYKIELEGPDGQKMEETIPAGIPIEVAGKENEYVPHELYIKNRGGKDNLAKFSISLNSMSPSIKISPREQIALFKRRAMPVEGSSEMKYKLESYTQSAGSLEASHLLVTLVKNISDKEGWAKPRVSVLNTSPEIFGTNQCLVYNSSQFPMQVIFAGKKVIKLEAFGKTIVKGLTPDKYGAIPYQVAMQINGKREVLPTSAFRARDDYRFYLFTFIDPRPGVVRRGDIVTFYEKVPKMPEPKTQ